MDLKVHRSLRILDANSHFRFVIVIFLLAYYLHTTATCFLFVFSFRILSFQYLGFSVNVLVFSVERFTLFLT